MLVQNAVLCSKIFLTARDHWYEYSSIVCFISKAARHIQGLGGCVLSNWDAAVALQER